MLESTAEQLTGISRAREGFTKSDAVGVNERSVMQSSLITQPKKVMRLQISKPYS